MIKNDNGFQIIWRYFSWCNQTLAMIALWVATSYLVKKGKYLFGSLITAIPATFMSAVTMTYILTADEGFRISVRRAYLFGIEFATALFVIYIIIFIRYKHKINKGLNH